MSGRMAHDGWHTCISLHASSSTRCTLRVYCTHHTLTVAHTAALVMLANALPLFILLGEQP